MRAVLPLLLLLLLPAQASAQLASAQLGIPPPPSRRVNDYAEALGPAEQERLERTLIERERTSSNQVVVAMFRSLAGENLEDYSMRLAQAWRIGQKGLDNGVIFLIFLDDRKMRLEVGYGLEPTLTDAIAGSIIRDVVAPRFRERRYADGIEAGLDAIDRTIAGTYMAPDRRPAPARGRDLSAGQMAVLSLLTMAVLAFVLWRFVKTDNARRRREGRRGWTAGRHGWGPADKGSSWSSGSDSSWSGGSSSGGFSGGGGSFGGGGASGSW